jgi:hypothetical protein
LTLLANLVFYTHEIQVLLPPQVVFDFRVEQIDLGYFVIGNRQNLFALLATNLRDSAYR